MKRILVLVLASVTLNAYAKDVALVCDGQVSLFPERLLDIDVSGAVFSVDERVVILRTQIPGISTGTELVFRVSKSTDAMLAFVLPEDLRVTGGLNRYTGEASLSVRSETNDKQFTRIFKANCRKRSKLF